MRQAGKFFALMSAVSRELLWRLHTWPSWSLIFVISTVKISNEVCQNGKPRRKFATWLVKISSGHLSPPVARQNDCKSFLISRRALLAHSHGNRFWARARHGRRDPAEICCKQTVNVTRRPSINFDCFVFFLLVALAWWLLRSFYFGLMLMDFSARSTRASPRWKEFQRSDITWFRHQNSFCIIICFPLAFRRLLMLPTIKWVAG